MKKIQKLILLDAHAIIHRAYHALPQFANREGIPTGALFGIITMLIKIIQDLKPDYIIACYDLPGKTFRHEAYDKYKDGRGKAEDDLIEQIKRSREICEAFCIPIYDKEGFEADDMLGTIVEQMKDRKDIKIIIASGDLDTLQLVSKKRVQVFTLKKGINNTIIYDEKAVNARFSFGPKLLVDYKGLRGDPSDNIIGIKGIGEKTATTLITSFGSIENIYKNLKKNKEKFLSKTKGMKITPRIIKLLVEGEEDALFSKALATIRRDAPINFKFPELYWRECLNFEKIDNLFKKYEFRGLMPRLKKALGIEEEEKKLENIPEKEVKKVAIKLWILNSDKANADLDDIISYAQKENFLEVKKYIDMELKKENLEKIYKEIEEPIIQIVYEMENNGVLVDKKFFKKLSKDYGEKISILKKEIWKIAGEKFNVKSPKQLSEILFEKMKLPTKGIKKTASGSYSTNIQMLEKLQGENQIIEKIIEFREIQKLFSTYVEVIPKMVGEDGRLHANFVQNGTTTGRFSSRNPNMQNIPIRSEAGRHVRDGFISKKGTSFVSFDYSQIELRVLALLSRDKKLTKIFKGGKDVHKTVASYIYGVDEDKITSNMRRHAKVINFGIIYGMGINSLKKSLGTSKEEAERFYLNFFKNFSRVKEYLKELKFFAQENLFTETLFGRRRQIKDINAKISFIRAFAERTAINAPIQGTAADIIKLALKDSVLKIREMKLQDKAKIILQIHDELIFEIDDNILDEITPIIKKTMEEVLENSFLKIKSKIPMEVSVEIGKRWGELH